MAGGGSLLEAVQGLLERTYRMETGVGDVARYVIGDRTYRSLYGSARLVTSSFPADPGGARTLVRETAAGVRASIYLPDLLVRRLEESPPQYGLRDENVDEFAVLVEELDHLLCIAERARLNRSLTFFELELHAFVSKDLVLTRFLTGARRRPDPPRRIWLRWHLFERGADAGVAPELRRRYRDAAAYARRFLHALADRRPPRRLEMLRKFHDAPAWEKVAMIDGFTFRPAPS